jgi:diguanylate cyclase (GGDEF)-like protein
VSSTALPRWAWLFGHERRQRIVIQRSLTAALVYAVCLAVLWWAVHEGLADAGAARWLSLVVVGAPLTAYAVLRSGATRGWADPSVAVPQMAAAIGCLAAAYAIIPAIRGSILMVAALVVTFGAYTLTPRATRLLALFAVALLGSVMLVMSHRHPLRFDPIVERLHFAMVAAVLPTLSLLAGQLSALRKRMKQQAADLQLALERIQRLPTRDELTGLYNRRHLRHELAREADRAQRQRAPLALCRIDVDHFKPINDQHGHALGDEVLCGLSDLLLRLTRTGDILGRWGGEEFLLLLPATPLTQAAEVVDRLRAAAAAAMVSASLPELRVTISAGLAPVDAVDAVETALEQADRALYRAKAEGRNRVCTDAAEIGATSSAIQGGA